MIKIYKFNNLKFKENCRDLAGIWGCPWPSGGILVGILLSYYLDCPWSSGPIIWWANGRPWFNRTIRKSLVLPANPLKVSALSRFTVHKQWQTQAKMELSLGGNALKTFARCITCLARVGNELVIQASPSQVNSPPPPNFLPFSLTFPTDSTIPNTSYLTHVSTILC